MGPINYRWVRTLTVLLLVAIVTFPTQAGSLTMHAALSDYAGQVAANDLDAGLLGFLGHAAIDTWLEDPVVDWRSPDVLRKQVVYIAADATLTGLVLWRANQAPEPERSRRLVAITAGFLPDIIDGVYSLICSKCWMEGNLLMPWHDAIRYKMDENGAAVWSASLLALTW